ncbi:hypothetical protein VTN31DRAFT_1671 [Thermomyces dupontii]|uniref:uncharacterized protein n=1 Tax=Talaromyces thermophilus TaxID=28565 RepID=UPI0037440CE0
MRSPSFLQGNCPWLQTNHAMPSRHLAFNTIRRVDDPKTETEQKEACAIEYFVDPCTLLSASMKRITASNHGVPDRQNSMRTGTPNHRLCSP